MDDLQSRDAVTIVSVADLHINSTVGLAPPVVRLDDGGTCHHSRFQGKLWDCWCDLWQHQIRRTGGEVWGLLVGDLVDGDHHQTPQIFSRNLTDQHVMAITALAPMLEVVDRLWVVRGTPAHVRACGQSEELIAREIGAQQTPGGQYSWYRITSQDWGRPLPLDAAHHGSLGRLPWTKGNLAKRLAIEIELEYGRMRLDPPQFAVRAHRHTFADSGMDAPVRVLFLPAWQGATDYVQIVAPGALPQVGALIFDIDKGAASFRLVPYTENLSCSVNS